ncbi:f-box domain-containing protein [Cyclospora cayetanensis]|uniref:F-box domain-containing protein n=1 Tax=Cyclospora cayetanensis TaxID=88456 RepID=A0A1D3CUA6_9EIME|nr:f-box domain-containing protein [Cyclospora cayetanensis]
MHLQGKAARQQQQQQKKEEKEEWQQPEPCFVQRQPHACGNGELAAAAVLPPAAVAAKHQDFPLDVSLRNLQLTVIAGSALYVFDSHSLRCLYTVLHTQGPCVAATFNRQQIQQHATLEGAATEESAQDLDFLWAGYANPCPSRRNVTLRNTLSSEGGSTGAEISARLALLYLRGYMGGERGGGRRRGGDTLDSSAMRTPVGVSSFRQQHERGDQTEQHQQHYLLAALDGEGILTLYDSCSNFACVCTLNCGTGSGNARAAAALRIFGSILTSTPSARQRQEDEGANRHSNASCSWRMEKGIFVAVYKWVSCAFNI